MLAAARACILIDEPSIGLSPKLVQEVMTLLRGLAGRRHDRC
jgi:ABC-type branched-subunit amino acid transport system ATPase component